MHLPVSPMLAEPAPTPDIEGNHWPHPFGVAGWLFEVKWDGIRCIASKDHRRTTLYARSGNIITSKYPEIAEAINDLPGRFVLDGELVALDIDGRSSFHRLQNAASIPRSELRYVAFDVLSHLSRLDERDLTSLPLAERRQHLLGINPSGPLLVTSYGFADGHVAWRKVLENEWEGLIAKPLASRYLQGRRGPWLKLKRNVVEEFIAVGYTPGEGSREGLFGALVLAQYRDGKLIYAGKCGTGFNRATTTAIFQSMYARRLSASMLDPGQAVRAVLHAGKRGLIWTQPFTVRVEFNDYAGPERVVRMGSFKGVVA